MNHNLPKSLLADIKQYGLELADDGKLYVPRANVKVGGVYDYELRRGGELFDAWNSHNLVVNQGLNYLLDAGLGGAAQITPWYVGLFEGNYNPVATDTAANYPANATECTAYNEATRQTYVEAPAAAQSMTNSANRATFTFNANKTIYGAFLTSVSNKGGATGSLFSADRAAVQKAVGPADQLLVTYTISIAAT